MERTVVLIKPEHKEKLSRLAEIEDVSAAEIIRRAIEAYEPEVDLGDYQQVFQDLTQSYAKTARALEKTHKEVQETLASLREEREKREAQLAEQLDMRLSTTTAAQTNLSQPDVHPLFANLQELLAAKPPGAPLGPPPTLAGKSNLVAKMANSAGISRAQAEKALAGFLGGVSNALRKGDKVTLVGFGTFSVAKRAAREGLNPQTGKKIKIKATKVVKFKAGSKLKSMVK